MGNKTPKISMPENLKDYLLESVLSNRRFLICKVIKLWTGFDDLVPGKRSVDKNVLMEIYELS